MKIDRGKVKKVPADPPLDTKSFMQTILSAAADEEVLLKTLSEFKSWVASKCELYHWTDVLNRFDEILAAATESTEWMLACDLPGSREAAVKRQLIREILRFTSMLIEHSFSRHLYNSMDRLIALLNSSDMVIVQSVLALLYTFSKRSSFLTRLRDDSTKGLFLRLQLLAESWGGKVNGFGLAKCCEDVPLESFPATATTVHFEFFSEQEVEDENGLKRSVTNVIHVENVDKMKPKTVPEIMSDLVREYSVPEAKQIPLYFHLRLAYSFADYSERLHCVHARLLSLAILAYTNHVPENLTSYIYSGLVEELVDVLQLKSPNLLELKSTVMRTLTAVVHHDRGSRCLDIIDATSSSSYHGFLPVLVRTCIQSLTESRRENFPAHYATAVFSFLYHMASYESGGDALVSCGMMESMLKVVNWYDTTEENITFVTRAVRVIDLITNMDMASFQNHNGLSVFTRRLEHEVEICRKEQPYVIHVQSSDSSQAASSHESDSAGGGEYEPDTPAGTTAKSEPGTEQCFAQRAALLKSILNFLKKIIPDVTFTDSIRHLMDGSLPSSLKHIISNAEYYGSSLFLLATDIVTVYVFHEPAMLTSLQDRGLTDIILQAVLVKDLPPTREVLSAIPNICSALCLNARGLQAFVACKPFEKLFKVLLSPDYLPAMRRRRTGEGYGDTAAGLGAAVDELMRHQPSLRTQAMQDIVKLLHQLCEIGRDSSNICMVNGSVQQGIQRQNRPDQSLPGDSSDEDDEFEDSQQGGSTSFHSVPSGLQLAAGAPSASDTKEKVTVPLLDYIINVTKFVEAVLTSNSTDDHCREFIRQEGLKPLMEIFRLPNLPLEFPYSHACIAANALVKSVVAYCRDQHVLDEAFKHMEVVLNEIKDMGKSSPEPGGSAILSEWAKSAPNVDDAMREPASTPLLHHLCYMHSYVSMMTQICKLNQSDIRTLCTNAWATEVGLRLLHEIADLYSFLIWENTILIALCSEEGLLPNESDISKADLKIILMNRKGASEEDLTQDSNAGGSPMDVDDQPSTSSAAPKKPSQPTRLQVATVRLLKPPITIATKLCRITSELLSLMVKFCVNPARPRRHAVGARGEVPSGHARNVATTISSLMSQVINRKGPLPNPPVRFRLNYLICVLTLIQPLLFDEKRFAYHFMLQKFVSVGTIDAFFGAFKSVLKGPNGELDLVLAPGMEKSSVGQFVVDFAVSWLAMLEKLLSPKNILESPNTLPISRIPIAGYVAPFDPVSYYIEMLHSTLQVIDKLLSLQALKNFGESTGDLLLTILSHVMKIEAIIKEKTPSTAAPSSDAAGADGASSSAAPAAAPTAPQVPPVALQSLMDMGFSREAAAEALVYHANNVEQAADYLLAVQPDRALRAGGRARDMDADANDDELMSQAIAMSIGERLPGPASATDGGASSSVVLPRTPILTPPSAQEIETLIARALPLCIDLVDFAPECVFKVADLISVISKRNGTEWRMTLIRTLAKDAVNFATSVIQTADKFYCGDVQLTVDTADINGAAVDALRGSAESHKLSARLHLLCILIQENQDECGAILDGDNLIPLLINLITAACKIHGLVARGSELVPKWLAFSYLILDSYEKMCAASKRKRVIQQLYAPTWKWLDVRMGRWTPYSDQNNQEITEAYDKGFATCKLSGQGTGPVRNYVIRFKDMVQLTDSTGSRRPIMRDLKKPEAKVAEPAATEATPAATATTTEASETGAASTDAPPAAANNGSPMQTDQDQPDEKNTALPVLLTGLLPEQKRSIINNTVSLIFQKLDGDTLQAAMRILLRLTRDYEMAQLFAELKGPQILFGLDRRSQFDSFTSFLTHLIRHIIENNSLLDYSMEKFCSWLTYGVVSSVAGTSFGCNAVREANYVMRVAWPGAARNSEKFIQCAKKTIHFNTPPGAAAGTRTDDPNLRTDFIKPTPPKRNIQIGREQPDSYKKILKQLIADLLDLLIAPWEPEVKKPDKREGSKESTTTATGDRSTGASASQRNQNMLQQLLQQQSEEMRTLGQSGAPGAVDSDQTLWKTSDRASRPVLKKSMVLRMLAELVKSYNHVATYILSHSYVADQSPLVKEEICSLGFILDNFVHVSQKSGDDYCQYSARVLMAALAAAFENPLAQMQVVEEVKQALHRATILPESQEKHERIGALANIIHTMVEACPTRVADPTGDRSVQFVVNHMGRCMAKRNLINDLAKIPHSLDLRSPHLASTINCVLRPLEVLTRIASQPDKPKARSRFTGPAVSHTGRSTTAGNAEASDLTPMSGLDDSQRTENDVIPISDEMNIADAADLHDLYFMTPAMDVDTDNQQGASEGEDDEPVDRPERRNRIRNRELDISMEEDNSDNDEDDLPNQARSPGPIADEDAVEADEDEEMQDEEEDDEEEDEEDDEEDEDDFLEPAALHDHDHHHAAADGFGNMYRAAFDGGDWDEEHTFDDDMLAHLEDLFPGAAAMPHGHAGINMDTPLVFELAAGPGAIGSELQNGSTGTRQPPPPLAISSSHPLLARPPAVMDVGQIPAAGYAAAAAAANRLGIGSSDISVNARGSRVVRLRATQFAGRLGATGVRLSPPAILARLLGPAFQLYPGDMVVQNEGGRQTAHRTGGAIFWGDHDYLTAGGSRQTEQEDLMLVDDPIFLGTSGLVNSLPSLVKRWSEEARVLDGDNAIECADAARPFILPELEEARDKILKEMKKDNPETTATGTTAPASGAIQIGRRSYRPAGLSASADGLSQRLASSSDNPTPQEAATRNSILEDLARIQENVALQAEAVAAIGQAVAARAANDMDQSDSDNSDDYSSHLSEDTDGELQDAVIDMVRADGNGMIDLVHGLGAVADSMDLAEPTDPVVPVAPLATPETSTPTTAAPPVVDMDASVSAPVPTETAVVPPPVPVADPPPAETTGQTAGSSTATTGVSDSGYPEGIDPSFLEALPENMRQEVIADFMRMQRLQRQTQEREARSAAAPAAAATEASGASGSSAAGTAVAGTSSAFDINPEFLAALPPNIQEEVLAQQRAEQARVAAQTAAPDAPFDPANFIQSLAPSLRRQILADIDDTLLTVLPDNVAQEARTLRREVEHRHIFAHGPGGGAGGAGGGLAFDGDVIAFMRGRFPTLRRGGGAARPYPGNFATRGGGRGLRIRARTQNAGNREPWMNGGLRASAWDRYNPEDPENTRVLDIDYSSKVTAKPILDYEGLTCVLVLYFLNSPTINIGRVQRIFRNICHHASTREWVFDAVMSMLRKADDSTAQETKKIYSTIKPNWLNISIDAALGCRANVFQLLPRQVKRPQTLQIAIHPQAAQIVCGNLLECLMLLAKNFPEQFVPYAIKTGEREREHSTRQPKSPSRSAPRTPASSASKAVATQDFWDILVRLDAQVGTGIRKPVKSTGKLTSAGPMHVVELGPDEPLRMVEFANSGLGQLIMMLHSEIFQKIPDLSDRLLRLIASIAGNVHKRDLGVPVLNSAVARTARTVIRPGKLTKKERDIILWKAVVTRYYNPDMVDPTAQPPFPIVETEGGDYTANSAEVSDELVKFLVKLDPMPDLEREEMKNQVDALAADLSHLSTPGALKFVLTLEADQTAEIEHLLRQLVAVLIARRCSEEGLEDITHTLIMLAQRLGTSVRQSIGQMLLDGIRELAKEVSTQIELLMKEAIAYNVLKAKEKAEEQDLEAAEGAAETSAKGVLADRFTAGETVVLYKSKGKSQGSSEVHLSGMTQLTGKSSCQTFMLKLLKVIIDLRGTARTSLRSKASDKAEECPNGTVNSIARRLLEMSYLHRQRKTATPPSLATETPMDVDMPPLEANNPSTSTPAAGPENDTDTTTARPTGPPPPPPHAPVEPEIDLPALSDLLNVDTLWMHLSNCLGELEKTGDQNAVLILQPTVESFFLVHAKEKQNADKRENATSRAARQPAEAAVQPPPANVADEHPPNSPAPGFGETASLVAEQGIPSTLPSDVQKFLRFAETHKVVLNQILRQSTQALTEGPFAVLVDHTRVLDFDVKRKYFRHELDRVDAHRMRREDLALRIRRAHVFEDSFRDLHRRLAEDWKARFYIMFEGEEGQDAGGLLREWYSIISRDIFNPNYALFRTSPGDRVTYMINSHSHINSNHLSYFRFVGRLIAKAIYDNKLLDCFFTRSFYKHILGKPVKYTDMESEDYAFYQGLVYLLNHPVEEVGSELSFSTEVQEFGVTEVKDLKPNGQNIPVTNETKQEYVRLACQMKMTHAIRKQLDSFLEGFYEVIPKRLISIFNEQELELLISGLPNIDVDDLKANTDYHKYQVTSLQIQWFWRAIRSFDQADRAKFLQFVTGTSKVPLQGFAALEGMSGAQKFQIHRDDRSTDRLPSAHTCFNQLDLPAYETYDKLRTMLSTAIHECSEGFGFA